MECMDVMAKRRSIRTYLQEPVSDEAISRILQAGFLAPSGRARYSAEAIVVRDRDLIRKMSDVRQGGKPMLKEADAAIVVIGNTALSDTWIEDCSLMMSYMQLEAVEQGLGSCWIHCRNRSSAVVKKSGEDGLPEAYKSSDEFLHDLLGIPEHYSAEAVLSLGIPGEQKTAHAMPSLDSPKIHHEAF